MAKEKYAKVRDTKKKINPHEDLKVCSISVRILKRQKAVSVSEVI